MFYENEFRGDPQDFTKCDVPGCPKQWERKQASREWAGVTLYRCHDHALPYKDSDVARVKAA